MEAAVSKLEVYHVRGRPAMLHPECVEGFREDRRAGMIYGPYHGYDPALGKKRFFTNAEEASMVLHFCPYCGQGEDK